MQAEQAKQARQAKQAKQPKQAKQAEIMSAIHKMLEILAEPYKRKCIPEHYKIKTKTKKKEL